MANGKGSGKNSLWNGRRSGVKAGSVLLIAAVGIIAIALAALLQSSPRVGALGSTADNAGSVRIRAFCADNVSRISDDGEAEDWIEVENAGSSPVSLERYALLLESDINKIYTFPKQMLAPGEVVTVWACGDEADESTCAPFRLPASGGDTLVLLDPRGKACDAVEMPELRADESCCRTADGSWQIVAGTGAGIEGSIQVFDDVLEITEVMSDNTLYCAGVDGSCADYVEIHNRSGAPVHAEGWFLSDASDDLKKWVFPDVTIPAGGYLNVFCTGESRSTDAQGRLCASFKLASSGESVYLTRQDGRCVSSVEIPALESNQAYSLENGAWTTEFAPTPEMPNDRANANALRTHMFSGLSGVFINEIMASPDEQNDDWIELYNGSSAAVDLSGCGLSNDTSKPRKYQFPAGTVLQPGQYVGIFCSGTTETTLRGFLNANFSLGIEGGYTVCLSDPNGKVCDAVYLPQQYTGISYGRSGNTGEMLFFAVPTPGMANEGDTYAGKAAMAVPSVTGGLFKTGDAFTVELSAPAGSEIYYTLDSSDPTRASTLYTAPITITGTTILRTRVWRGGFLESYIDTQSYLYDVQTAQDVYVVSLVSDVKNLTDPDTGIMVEGNNRNTWKDWEREASLEMFTADGRRVIGQGCGISLHGQSSRDLPVKTFNVIARGTFGGKKRFNYPIFRERDYDSYQAILLRPSGEDYAKSFMRDSLQSSLLGDSELMYQKWELAVVYIDGQYYSLMYVRERVNKFSICQFEGWEGMEDDLDIVRGNSSTTQGSNESFKALQKQLESMNTNTDEAYQLIDANIDIDNYIEYLITEIYTANTDLINVRRYRNAKVDGKWRWVVFDFDWGFNLDKDSILDWLDGPGVGVRDATDNSFFVACIRNDRFRDRFLTRFGELMATKFASATVVPQIEARAKLIAEFIPQYAQRWKLDQQKMANAIAKLIDFAETRPNLLINTYTRNAMRLSDADMEKYFGEANRMIAAYGK